MVMACIAANVVAGIPYLVNKDANVPLLDMVMAWIAANVVAGLLLM